MMDNSIQIPLDLPDVRVLELSKKEEGFWLIRIESTLSGTLCRKCGQELTAFHGFDQPIRGMVQKTLFLGNKTARI